MKTRMLGAALVLGLGGAALAGDATFTIIGDGDAVDISPDGQYVLISTGAGAAIWTKETGVVGIGGQTGVGMSNDGTIVCGQISDPDTGNNVAGLWTMGIGWVALGGLGETGCPDLSNPYDLSGDGMVAVGLGWDVCDASAFRWTEGTGMEALPQIGPNATRANGISKDGLTIGGWDEAANGTRRAAIWYDDSTEELPLEGYPGNATGAGEVWGFSTDGTISCGQAHQDLATGGGFVIIDDVIHIIPALSGTDPQFHTIAAFATSDDGARVGGTNISGFGPFATRTATLWETEEGVQDFADVLVANGAEIPIGITSVDWIKAMTPDGSTFVGLARQGFSQLAFIATLPSGEPCRADVDGDGMVSVTDLTAVILAWGDCPGCPEDIDGDGMVSVTDLTAVILAWGPCE